MKIYLFVIAATMLSLPSFAAIEKKVKTNTPKVAIIIDDIGYRKSDLSLLSLSGQYTFAIVPYAPYTKKIATLAHKSHREVMAHIPMEAFKNNRLLGEGALKVAMSEEQTRQQVRDVLINIPHVKGINNHMGSYFTTQSKHLSWVMDELAKKDLFFVDSKTTANSMAEKVAIQHGVSTGHRHIFIDNQLDEAYLNKQFKQLVRIAKQHQYAIAIAHPHPESIAFLQNKNEELKSMGINLVPVSELITTTTLLAKEKYLKQEGGKPQLIGSAIAIPQ